MFYVDKNAARLASLHVLVAAGLKAEWPQHFLRDVRPGPVLPPRGSPLSAGRVPASITTFMEVEVQPEAGKTGAVQVHQSEEDKEQEVLSPEEHAGGQ